MIGSATERPARGGGHLDDLDPQGAGSNKGQAAVQGHGVGHHLVGAVVGEGVVVELGEQHAITTTHLETTIARSEVADVGVHFDRTLGGFVVVAVDRNGAVTREAGNAQHGHARFRSADGGNCTLGREVDAADVELRGELGNAQLALVRVDQGDSTVTRTDRGHDATAVAGEIGDDPAGEIQPTAGTFESGVGERELLEKCWRTQCWIGRADADVDALTMHEDSRDVGALVDDFGQQPWSPEIGEVDHLDGPCKDVPCMVVGDGRGLT